MTINLGEQLTFEQHRIFRAMLEEAVAASCDITFDCGSLSYIDSAGLGMLLLAKHESEKINKKVALRNIQAQALELLKTVSFDKHFELTAHS